jgi:hypothetical protein
MKMRKSIACPAVLTVLLSSCASGKDAAQSAAVSNARVAAAGGTQGQNERSPAGTGEVRDKQMMDISAMDASEETGWMNLKNPPELKRKYQKTNFSILLPEDLYPIKTNAGASAGLFKFQNTDALVYILSPRGKEASAFLDINLNTLALDQPKGYHDMVIDLKESVLNMSYRFDGSPDGYIRYVEIRKTYQPAGLFISALLVRDSQTHTSLQKEYRAVLGTLKHGSD